MRRIFDLSKCLNIRQLASSLLEYQSIADVKDLILFLEEGLMDMEEEDD
jgi:hypothetical protein